MTAIVEIDVDPEPDDDSDESNWGPENWEKFPITGWGATSKTPSGVAPARSARY